MAVRRDAVRSLCRVFFGEETGIAVGETRLGRIDSRATLISSIAHARENSRDEFAALFADTEKFEMQSGVDSDLNS